MGKLIKEDEMKWYYKVILCIFLPPVGIYYLIRDSIRQIKINKSEGKYTKEHYSNISSDLKEGVNELKENLNEVKEMKEAKEVKEEEKKGGVLASILTLALFGAIGYGVYYFLTVGLFGFSTVYATLDGKEYEITSKSSIFDLGPEQQQKMRKFINDTKASIPDDASKARKKRTWIDASKRLCNSNEFDIFGLKTNWVGSVDKVLMKDNGRVAFQVQIDETDNEVQQSEIPKRFENVVVDLKEDDIVKFSGKFKRGKLSENECLDGGLDSNPELYNEGFTFRFTNIEKIPTRN